MIDRKRIVDATKKVFAQPPVLGFDAPTIGGLIADELGFPAAPSIDPLDNLGTGVFVRRLKDWPIDVVSRFGWVCVAILSGERRSINRDVAWYTEARAAGVKITVFDWLPAPDNYTTGLAAACAFANKVGALSFVNDAEKEWRGAEAAVARAYVDAVKRGGQRFGFTSYALVADKEPWRTFLRFAELAINQPYDGRLLFEPDYAKRSCENYRKVSSKPDLRLALGRGAHRRDDPATPQVEAWKTVEQLKRHRELGLPTLEALPHLKVGGTCYWFPAGQPKKPVVDAIVG